MKVFVAGGTGVVGLPSVRALVEAGHDVRASARTDAKAALVREAGAQPMQVDLYDVLSLRAALKGCDAVVRLTSKIADSLTEMRSQKMWLETNRLRTTGARRIVDAGLAEGVGTYVHESYYGVYAEAADRLVDEAAPTDGGGVSTMEAALAGEQEAERFSAAGGRGIVLRFGAFYGPQAPSTVETVAFIRRRFLPLIGDGRNFFASLYVDDAASAVVRSLAAPSGVYNVCDDEPVRWAEYLQTIAQVTGARRPLHLPAFAGPLLVGFPWRWITRSIRLSNATFKSRARWSPAVKSVREGWPAVVRELALRRAALRAVA